MKGMKFNLIFIFSSSSFFANFIEKLKRWEKEKRKIISLLLFVCFSEENSLRKAKKVFLLIFFFLIFQLIQPLLDCIFHNSFPSLPSQNPYWDTRGCREKVEEEVRLGRSFDEMIKQTCLIRSAKFSKLIFSEK